MKCPKCKHNESKVTNSRTIKNGEAIRRRRECLECGHRFTTYEYIERTEILIQKNNGITEEYNREKVKNGILIACRKRAISPTRIDNMVDEIYAELTEHYSGVVKSAIVGELVMNKLKETDEVAYIRFASVYRKFKDVKEFMNELENIVTK